MTDRQKHIREVVRTLLLNDQGEALIELLKEWSEFEKPVFKAEDGFNDTRAMLRDGGRQLVCQLLNLQKSQNLEIK